MNSNLKLVGLTLKQAQYAAMAPSVAGGWVATQLPTITIDDGQRMFEVLVALVPTTWSDGSKMERAWVERAWDHKNLLDWQEADAAEKLASLA